MKLIWVGGVLTGLVGQPLGGFTAIKSEAFPKDLTNHILDGVTITNTAILGQDDGYDISSGTTHDGIRYVAGGNLSNKHMDQRNTFLKVTNEFWKNHESITVKLRISRSLNLESEQSSTTQRVRYLENLNYTDVTLKFHKDGTISKIDGTISWLAGNWKTEGINNYGGVGTNYKTIGTILDLKEKKVFFHKLDRNNGAEIQKYHGYVPEVYAGYSGLFVKEDDAKNGILNLNVTNWEEDSGLGGGDGEQGMETLVRVLDVKTDNANDLASMSSIEATDVVSMGQDDGFNFYGLREIDGMNVLAQRNNDRGMNQFINIPAEYWQKHRVLNIKFSYWNHFNKESSASDAQQTALSAINNLDRKVDLSFFADGKIVMTNGEISWIAGNWKTSGINNYSRTGTNFRVIGTLLDQNEGGYHAFSGLFVKEDAARNGALSLNLGSWHDDSGSSGDGEQGLTTAIKIDEINSHDDLGLTYNNTMLLQNDDGFDWIGSNRRMEIDGTAWNVSTRGCTESANSLYGCPGGTLLRIDKDYWTRHSVEAVKVSLSVRWGRDGHSSASSLTGESHAMSNRLSNEPNLIYLFHKDGRIELLKGNVATTSSWKHNGNAPLMNYRGAGRDKAWLSTFQDNYRNVVGLFYSNSEALKGILDIQLNSGETNINGREDGMSAAAKVIKIENIYM